MRIAVVSDIHANLTALEAVLADLKQVSPDVIVNGGDLVGSGSSPAEVVDRIRGLGWPGVQGNTDEMLWNLQQVDEFFRPPPLQPWRAVVARSIAFTLDALGRARLEWLRTLPTRWADHDLTVVHAGPDDCWRSPADTASDEELSRIYGTLGTGRVVYGHIHRPYVRRLPSFTVANSGSVSLPHDGDPRAAYAVVDDGGITIRRVEYDLEREAAALMATRCPDAEWIADTLRQARPLPPPAD